MSVRLPIVGSDYGQWGVLLNAFLNVAHRSDGRLKSSSPILNVLDYADVYAAFADLTARGGGELYIPSGAYAVDALHDAANGCAFSLPSHCRIVFAPGAVFQVTPNAADNYQVFRLNAVTDVEIIGGTIIGDRATHLGTTGAGGHGITVRGSTNVRLRGLTIQDMWGDGAWIGYSGSAYSQDVLVEDCSFLNNRRNNASLVAVQHFRAVRSKFNGANGSAPQKGIDCEFENFILDNLVFEDCESNDNVGGGFVFDMHAGAIARVRIDGGLFSGNGMDAIGFNADAGHIHAGPLVTHVRCEGNGRYGIFANQVDDGLIEANTVWGNSLGAGFGVPGIYVYGNRNRVLGNSVAKKASTQETYGVSIYGGVGNIVALNELSDGGIAGNLYVDASATGTVQIGNGGE